jgi:negative regulator of flagellin synthesis FlgM
MVDPVGNSGVGRLDPARVSPRAKIGDGDRKVPPSDGSTTPAARFARLGPPIDVTRVSEIKAAIAEGSYTVDADRLAAAMLALDLPAKKA